MTFFASLNFSSTNEDGETELAALAGTQRILALTGSGTRVLDLLLSGAVEIVAIDSNPVQNALLELKVAAIEHLDRSDCLAFLGLAPSRSRLIRYAALRERLNAAAQAYWDVNPAMVETGIWHAGGWERLLRWNARSLALFRWGALGRLMSAATPDKQAAIWRDRFTSSRLRRTVEATARDMIWRWSMREPAGAFLPDPRRVTERLEADFARAARTFLFRGSDTATLLLRGRQTADGPLPLYLRAKNYDTIRKRTGRLRVVEGDLARLAELGLGQADGFSLSDFGSYCGPDDYAACWRGVTAMAAPGARYCERIFMNAMPPPLSTITVDADLSAALTASDRSIIYRIRAGTIGSAPDVG